MDKLDEEIDKVEKMLAEAEKMAAQNEPLSPEKTVSDTQGQAAPETSPFGSFYALLGPLNPL